MWNVILPVSILLLFMLLVLIYKLRQLEIKERTAEDKFIKNELLEILNILNKNNGRMTQKDLRKQIPISEAQMSLLLTELESIDKIKKIKKGRSNVIILK